MKVSRGCMGTKLAALMLYYSLSNGACRDMSAAGKSRKVAATLVDRLLMFGIQRYRLACACPSNDAIIPSSREFQRCLAFTLSPCAICVIF
jgi:hypothetical protein